MLETISHLCVILATPLAVRYLFAYEPFYRYARKMFNVEGVGKNLAPARGTRGLSKRHRTIEKRREPNTKSARVRFFWKLFRIRNAVRKGAPFDNDDRR